MSTYSLFRQNAPSRNVLIYTGNHTSQPHIPADYEILFNNKKFCFAKNNSADWDQKLLHGEIKGLVRKRVLINGGCGTSIAKPSLFSVGWSFTYSKDVFKWHMSQNARKWVLRNAYGLEIAVLDRTSNVGILCVVGGVVERFIATIVLTAVIAVDSCAKN